jgi:hypothetical protein
MNVSIHFVLNWILIGGIIAIPLGLLLVWKGLMMMDSSGKLGRFDRVDLLVFPGMMSIIGGIIAVLIGTGIAIA